jgi:NAD(P)-dependent dehydrogenase (short-subunit alcohol dehydrogenase family)
LCDGDIVRLQNNVCVVTGAAHGIGRAIAALYCREGAQVVLADRDEEAGRELECDRACFIRADVARPDDIATLFDAVARRYGALHVLVNDAGLTVRGTPGEASLEDWEFCLNTNLRSAWLCAKAAVPLMQPHGGSIINITSSHAHRTMQGFFPYSVSKGGMEALTRALAVEYGPVGIRANAIAPGMIRSRHTESVLAQYRDPAEAYRRILDSHPLRRIGDPQDIANAALFLASGESSFITGTTLLVDGGRHVQALNLNGSRKDAE